MEADKLLIRQGLFFRDEKTIYYSRIHSVQVEQPLLQRLFGMAQLKIETPGGSGESDGVLPTLSQERAEELRSLLMQRSQGRDWPEDAAAEGSDAGCRPEAEGARALPLVRMPAGQLFVGALSTVNPGLVLAFFAGLLSFADDMVKLIVPKRISDQLLHAIESSVSGPVSLAILGAGALLGAWLLSSLLYIVKYYGFTAEERVGSIVVTYGLFEKKMNAIKPDRAQAIVVKEGLLRQALGYAEIEVRVVSSDMKEALMLHPYVPVRDGSCCHAACRASSSARCSTARRGGPGGIISAAACCSSRLPSLAYTGSWEPAPIGCWRCCLRSCSPAGWASATPASDCGIGS
ncbi:PH domain-containing protein [Paenibacillus melissococcoides]|uniref:PH domain-containing protein n=1 Tax=Paenibacillus melissococcoides TaxID=2912268 RepID=A0ABM9GAX3_9BACL|nr:hypothetical protein J6TS7_25380 [Paenibacillus dendritiformis]CAH8249111.1 PH domain-containing protein [Paenibacillus melissococcoides]